MAAGDQRGPEWDELGKIDYFLEHLARAVERGEVHRASYETLAPRYLERRQWLANVIAGRAGRTAASGTSMPVAAQQPRPVPGVAAGEPPAAAVRPPQARQPQPRPARKPVPWTTVLTFTGAFLVIVASAIFAVATWDLFGVEFKLVFLGLLTAGFYGAAHLVRTRLNLASGSVVLTVVGSAMLLFDGWIAIEGYGLAGPLPWAVWLAVCSLVYFFTETALGGGFFGLTGAAAQVAWVWLLADGLGWPVPQRAAAVAIVALLWSFAARPARKQKPFTSLAAVLALAAPITVLLAAITVLGSILESPTGWAEIISALVVGLAATFVVQLAGLPPVMAALAHVPIFAALAQTGTGGEISYTIALFSLAAFYAVYELYRGGWGHGALALIAEFGAWLSLGDRFGWAGDVTLAVMVGLASSWLVAAYLLASRTEFRERFRGALSLERTAFTAGWATLGVWTLATPLARAVVPLSGTTVSGRDVALAVLVLIAWAGASVLHRSAPATVAAFVMSLYVVAASMAWLAPEWHSGLYATGLLVTASAWLFGRRHVARLTSLPADALAWIARSSTLLILAVGLVAIEVFFDFAAWQTALLFGAMSVWWLADALTERAGSPGLALSSAAGVACVATAVAAASDSPALLGWPGALAGLALAGIGVVRRDREGWSGPWVYGAAFAATVAAPFAIGEPGPLAVALALAALAWVVAAWSGGLPEIAIGAGVLAIGALLSVSAWLDAGPWVTYFLLVVPSFAALAPVALRASRPGTALARWYDALMVSGLLGILAALMVPLMAGDLYGTAPAWLDSGGHGVAASLLALGAYALASSALRDIELGPYVGVGLILFAYIVEWDTLGVGTTEWVSTPMALYVAWTGYRWARTHRASVPLVADVGTALIGLGVPALLATNLYPGNSPWTHLAWAVALSLVAIGLGVALRVRAYFFGGVAAIVFTALIRSWVFLVSFWWLVLGLIGITMLVVALTWEREQMVRSRVREALSDWR